MTMSTVCSSSPRAPRTSIALRQLKHHNKILQSCVRSKGIYLKNEGRDNMTINRYQNTLYVCFKGCSSASDLLNSIDIRNCKIHGETVGIHNGFCEKYKSMQHTILFEVLNELCDNPITDVVFTGHSAGGSIAQIVSLFLAEELMDLKLHCYTIGTPKTGDAFFKQTLEHELDKDKLLRLETHNDLICLLPMQPTFEHAGDVLIMKDGDIFNATPDEAFFTSYYTDYVDLIRDMTQSGLLSKKEVHSMIGYHSCESYLTNVRAILKKTLEPVVE